MKSAYIFGMILVSAAVTCLLRFAPFLFLKDKELSPRLSSLSELLPYSVMGMLVVYCLKDISLLEKPYGIGELAASLVTACLYVWKRNMLLSVIGGTLVYMILKQILFV